MIITDVKIRTIVGIVEDVGMIYDNKKVKRVAPTDIHIGYQKKKGHISVTHVPQEDGTYKITHTFLEIETSDNIKGCVGPISNPMPPYYILTYIKPIIIGMDPFEIEKIWDILYRTCVNGRKGENMQAISYVECALWDIKCKALNVPLYQLLGGKVQQKLRAYANTAGYPQNPEDIRNAARTLVAEGFTAIKWGVCYGPIDGDRGVDKLADTVRILRESVGLDVSIMLDAWSSWDIPFTLKAADALKEYNLEFIEEPVLADNIDSYAYLNKKSPIPISGGEHEYTRWGYKQLLDKDACAIYQPDPAWTGGIAEVRRIMDLVSAYDRKVLIHNSLPALGTQMSCAFPFSVVPMEEYLMLVGEATQYFYKTPCRPSDGYFVPLEVPGLGMDIDETKVDESHYLEV